MIEMSESIQELAAAFAKAQAKVQNAVRDTWNPEVDNAYPSLAAIWAACREALTKHHLSVVQFPGECWDDRTTMTTMLMHASGQWLRQCMIIPISRSDEQGYGAAVTYARRCALAAVIGICPEKEGRTAVWQGGHRQAPPSLNVPRGKIGENELAALLALAGEVGVHIPDLCEYLGVAALEDLPANQCLAAMHALEQRRAQRQ